MVEIRAAAMGGWGEVLAASNEYPQNAKLIEPKNGEGDDDYNWYIYPIICRSKKVRFDIIIINLRKNRISKLI